MMKKVERRETKSTACVVEMREMYEILTWSWWMYEYQRRITSKSSATLTHTRSL